MNAPSSSTPLIDTEVRVTPRAFAATTTAFVVMGTVVALFGPLLDSFSRAFHVSVASAGISVSVYFVGGLCGVGPAWLGLRHRRGGEVQVLALGVLALGAVAAAAGHAWLAFLAGLFVLGVGFGALDIVLNTLLARTAPRGRAFRLSVANAGYGVGAVLCPLAIVAIGAAHFRVLLLVLGGLALALALATRGIHAPPLHADERQRAIRTTPGRGVVLATFSVAFVLYVGLESSTSSWIAPELHGVGFAESTGSVVTAGFWLGLALARSVGGPLHRRFGERTLVLGVLVLAVAVALVALADPLAPYAFIVLGLLYGTVFPLGLLWYTTLCPYDSDGLSMMIFVMMIGGVAGPGVVSVLVAAAGFHVVPVVLASMAALAAVAFGLASRFKPLGTRS